jgi:hypothetical protein
MQFTDTLVTAFSLSLFCQFALVAVQLRGKETSGGTRESEVAKQSGTAQAGRQTVRVTRENDKYSQ